MSRRKFLQGIGTEAVAVSVAPTQLTATHNEKITTKSTKPNIVYFFVDDMGYGDASCLNSDSKIQTPNIDRLGREGMVFTDAHSSSVVCSPSRYSVLTGRYNWRSTLQKGIVGLYGSPLIPTDRLTVPAFLSQHGYHTACIGKWHLGQGWDFEVNEQDFHPRSNSTVRAPQGPTPISRLALNNSSAGERPSQNLLPVAQPHVASTTISAWMSPIGRLTVLLRTIVR